MEATTRVPRRDWSLRPAPKYAQYGVVRTVPPAQTIRRVAPLLDMVGVTRVAEVTGLDRVGIPNFTSVRPRERGEGISYYNGKGLTRVAARAGALMEAIERYTGEICDLPVYYCSRDEMKQRGPVIDPAAIVLPPAMEFRPDIRIEWVEGYDLLAEQPTYVPLNAVVFPYEPPLGRPILYDGGTNGLASGNTLEEAVCHALCEVIERDASAIADAWIDLAPAVSRILETLGMAVSEKESGRDSRFPLIELTSLPRRPLALVRKLHEAGLRVYLRDITSTAGIATLDCAIVESRLDGRHLVHGGTGTHPDARVAATRALTEASQSRLGHIQGGREDLVRIVRDAPSFDPDKLFGSGLMRPFSSVASFEHANVDDDIRFMLQRLKADGFRQIVVVDLTRPDVGVPVVRVVAPGMEAWSTYVTHGRRGQIGSRIATLLHERAGRA
jgi:YcaO-like protein with predicted kinase domain